MPLSNTPQGKRPSRLRPPTAGPCPCDTRGLRSKFTRALLPLALLLALLPLASAAGVEPGAFATGTVTMSRADCNLLAARKNWTRVRTCSPPPKCQQELFRSWRNPERKPGIWCNRDGDVTVIVIHFKRLKPARRPGTLPGKWGYLTSLRTMVLVGNTQLGGRIPASWGLLHNLTDLDVAYNPNLRGSIPARLARSRTLANLRVAYSGIRGTLDEFSRPSPNPALSNPLYLTVRKDKPEICFDPAAPIPNLVGAYSYNPVTISRDDLILPTCSATPPTPTPTPRPPSTPGRLSPSPRPKTPPPTPQPQPRAASPPARKPSSSKGKASPPAVPRSPSPKRSSSPRPPSPKAASPRPSSPKRSPSPRPAPPKSPSPKASRSPSPKRSPLRSPPPRSPSPKRNPSSPPRVG